MFLYQQVLPLQIKSSVPTLNMSLQAAAEQVVMKNLNFNKLIDWVLKKVGN